MADSFTPNLNMTKPEIDASAETWGQKLNADLDILDTWAGSIQGWANNQPAAIAAAVAAAINGAFPRGCIIAWAGQPWNVPAGWLLCNGLNGTPNMQDRFIMGNNGTRVAWEVGGNFGYVTQTDAQGSHFHSGNTAGHTLSENEMPAHQHGGYTDTLGWHTHSMSPNNFLAYVGSGGNANVGGGSQVISRDVVINGDGAHSHNLVTDWRGASWGHWHQIFADGNHQHNVQVNVVPPYLALCYIMRA